jgi:hypothetical protein
MERRVNQEDRLNVLFQQIAEQPMPEFPVVPITKQDAARLTKSAIYNLAGYAAPQIWTALAWFTAAKYEKVPMRDALERLGDSTIMAASNLPTSNFLALPLRTSAMGVSGGRHLPSAKLAREYDVPIIELPNLSYLLHVETVFNAVCDLVTTPTTVKIGKGKVPVTYHIFDFRGLDLDQPPPSNLITALYLSGRLTLDTLSAINEEISIKDWYPIRESERAELGPMPKPLVYPDDGYGSLLGGCVILCLSFSFRNDWRRKKNTVSWRSNEYGRSSYACINPPS